MQLLDARTGWVVTSGGLERTDDGGATWRMLGAPPHTRFSELRFVDARRGWALLHGGPGRPETACFFAASFPSGSPAPAACRAAVATTDDGGTTWTERLVVDDASGRDGIRSLQATDAGHAWVVVNTGLCDGSGCRADIRATNDGGRTWVTTRSGGGYPLALRMASASVGWLAVPRSVRRGVDLYRTSDGGSTWTPTYDVEREFQALATSGERHAWVLTFDGPTCTSSSCADMRFATTADGGQTWRDQGDPRRGTPCTGHVAAPVFGATSAGWAGIDFGAGGAGTEGGVLRTGTGGASWGCFEFDAPSGRFNVTSLSAAGSRDVWLIATDRSSGEARLYASADGGMTWRRMR
jgi:hypothetical protein